jgi:hypothetical protein
MACEALNNIAAATDLRLVIIVNDNGRSYSRRRTRRHAPTALTSSDHTIERTVSNRTSQPHPSPRRAHVNDPSSLVEGGKPPRRVGFMAHPAEP